VEISRLIDHSEKGQAAQKEQFSIDVLTGLCLSAKSISAKYFYDDDGSELFQKITQHEDYYLTRTEFEILNDIKNELPRVIGGGEIDIIELGAGDGGVCQRSCRIF